MNTILKFLGQPPNGSALLFKGSLPLTNPADSKGRRDIEPPQWTADLKKRTNEITQPDNKAFLKTLHWSNNSWQWDQYNFENRSTQANISKSLYIILVEHLSINGRKR